MIVVRKWIWALTSVDGCAFTSILDVLVVHFHGFELLDSDCESDVEAT